ncbi:TPA: hypothetical protein ACH3X3_010994 [Trebouxia sp. C0006]
MSESLSRAKLIQQAQNKFSFEVTKWNIAIVGQTKSGKSSLVNSLRGLRDTDSGAADVGITETTLQPEPYLLPAAASCVLWDMPGVNTISNPANTYFRNNLLGAFDMLLLVSADTVLEQDVAILQQAHASGSIVAVIRTKSDAHTKNIIYSEELHPPDAARKLAKDAYANMTGVLHKAGIADFPDLYIISNRAMLCQVKSSTLPESLPRTDEESLLVWILEQKPFLVPRIRQRRPPQPRLTRCCGESQGDTPLLTALKGRAEAQQAPFHVPGHKRGGRALDGARQIIGDTAFQHDFTELPGLDYLASPTSVIQQAQQLAATAFGADQTWFLVNGTSVGIHAAVMATCGPGDCLVLARNCHQSAFAAAVFAGCDTWYVQPHCDEQLGVAHGVHPSSLQQALDAARSAGKCVTAVLVVSPTYFGVCSDISGTACTLITCLAVSLALCHLSSYTLL